jgi:beta-lactamase class D
MTATSILLLLSLLLPAMAEDLRIDNPRHSTDDPQRRFREAGVTGCFLLSAIDGDSTLRIDAERCARRFTPASTFKILNSIIALEYGAVRDIDDTLRWDGRRHTIRSWNQDQCMRDAFQRSCVWFYQELARRIGADRMREAIAAVGYGNQDISGGIDQFWLDGSMKISADEQADLLRRLWNDDLPFSAASQRTVKQLMLLEETGRYTLRGKTGTAIRDGSWLGWLVGYVEQGGRTYVYVLNLEESGEGDLSTMRERRMELLRALLRDQGLL